ncbi:hypothetical protein [Bosea sp. UNC402CLCol]|uniref:hypothetical protein n=1 Tax=Bosea sp. UNC402CLCol TaxID=1510531 RepID=UPI0012E0526D|nr:hypothetical protein [Bosea sp. UNC402CLCol]
MIDGPQAPKEISPSDRFKALITNAESATYGLKDNLLTVMTRDGSATWQTVAAHVEAQLPGAGEFSTARLNAILALIRTLSNKRTSEPDDIQRPSSAA